MALPFNLQQFASEIVTGLAVLAATQSPKVLKWLKGRLKPDPQLSSMHIYTVRADLAISERSGGTVQVYADALNVSTRDLHLEQIQVRHATLDGIGIRNPQASSSPPRLSIPARSRSSFTIEFQLSAETASRFVDQARQQLRGLSSPHHHLSLTLDFIIERRLTRRAVGTRDVIVPMISVTINVPKVSA